MIKIFDWINKYIIQNKPVRYTVLSLISIGVLVGAFFYNKDFLTINLLRGWGLAFTFVAIMLPTIAIFGWKNGGAIPFTIDSRIDEGEKQTLISFFLKYPLWGTVQWIFTMAICEVILHPMGINPESGVYQFFLIIYPLIGTSVMMWMHAYNWHLAAGVGLLSLAAIFPHWAIHHNILAVGVMHGMCGTALSICFPSKLSLDFSIGASHDRQQKALLDD